MGAPNLLEREALDKISMGLVAERHVEMARRRGDDMRFAGMGELFVTAGRSGRIEDGRVSRSTSGGTTIHI